MPHFLACRARSIRLPLVTISPDQYLRLLHRITTTQTTIDSDAETIFAGYTYHVAIVLTNTILSLWVDDVLIGEAGVPDSDIGTRSNQPIYVSDPWNDVSSEVEVANFKYHDLDQCTFPPTAVPSLAQRPSEVAKPAAHIIPLIRWEDGHVTHDSREHGDATHEDHQHQHHR